MQVGTSLVWPMAEFVRMVDLQHVGRRCSGHCLGQKMQRAKFWQFIRGRASDRTATLFVACNRENSSYEQALNWRSFMLL